MDDLGSDRDQLSKVLDALLEGDAALWNSLRGRIARYVAFHFKAPLAAGQDLVSEILKVLLENLRSRQFRGGSLRTLNSYIYGIARFRTLRAAQLARREGKLETGDCELRRDGATTENPETIASARELMAKILAEIDPRSRELLSLKFIKGWSDQEIAEHLQMTKNAVSTAICRAIQKARNLDCLQGIL